MAFVSGSSFKKWILISTSLGFVAFGGFLFLSADLGAIASVIAKSDLYYFLLAVICGLVSVLFHALTWKKLLSNFSVETSFRRVVSLSLIGNFVDAVVPGGWSGDVFKGYLLSRDPRVDGGKTAASIVVKNILELLLTLGALVLGFLLLSLNYRLDNAVFFTIEIIIVLLSVPLICMIYFSTHLGVAMRIIRTFKRFCAFV